MYDQRHRRRRVLDNRATPLAHYSQGQQAYLNMTESSYQPNLYGIYSNIPPAQLGGYGPINPGYTAYPIQPNYQPSPPPPYQPQGYGGYQAKPKVTETVFHNPLQQPEMSYAAYQPSFGANPPFMHPYPKQSTITKPPSGMKTIMNSFKTQEGNFDVNKMVNTAGQMMNAVSQVSSMVKGIGGIFKV